MIGQVIWNQFDREWRAILEADLSWTVPDDPTFASMLDSLYDPEATEWGPADGHFGPAQLADLAAALGGRAELTSELLGEPGRIY